MIYGKLSLKDWHTAQVMGEEPDSVFESADLRLFFYGILYNRDVLQSTSEDSNAKIAAAVYTADPVYGFSRLDGSFTIVYYTEKECGIVRDHHGTHYPVYCTFDKNFATSWQFLQKQSQKSFNYNPCALSAFLQRGILKKGFGGMVDISVLEAGERFHIFSKDVNVLVRDSVFNNKFKVVIEKNPDIESYSHRYGELHKQAIRRRIGDSNRVGILLSGGYDSGSNLAALRSIYDGQIDSYSVGFKGDTWTELPMARLMSDTFGTRHHEYEIDGSEINALPDIVRFLGEPFVEGGLMVNYCAMRMIGDDKPEVILGGDGNDQYFWTAAREVALFYLANRIGMHPLLSGVSQFLNYKIFDTGGKLSRINFHLDTILHLLEGDRFGFSDSDMHKLLQHPEKDIELLQSLPVDTRSFEHLYTQHASVVDMGIIINRVVLYKSSRMARMFGNNLAFPFTDLDIYNFMQELPISLRCKGDSNWAIARGHCMLKYLLKYHYKSLFPETVASKKQQGGFAPMPIFFHDQARRAHFKDFILSSGIMDDYLCRDAVEAFLTRYDQEVVKSGCWFWYKQNKALQYFNLLTLVIWWEEFVERNRVDFRE